MELSIDRFAAGAAGSFNRLSTAGVIRDHRIPQIPADLETWFPVVQMVDWIKQEIEELAWDNPQVQDYLRQHPGYEPRILLGILTYGCVSAFRTSEQLARVCASQWPLSQLSNATRPFLAELIRFRRRNRRLLEHVVARVYRRAVLERFGADAFQRTPVLESQIRARTIERLDIMRHLDAAEE